MSIDRRETEPTDEEVAAVVALLASRAGRRVEHVDPGSGWAAYWRARQRAMTFDSGTENGRRSVARCP